MTRQPNSNFIKARKIREKEAIPFDLTILV
jgi:hypothetical protein